MTLSQTLRRVILAVAVVLLAAPPAAQAALIHGQSPARTGLRAEPAAFAHAAALPAGAASWRVPAQGSECCAEPVAPAARTRPGTTLSVNLAIVVLGTLWVGLMLRRIQLRSAMDDLRGAAPRHAAGGH